MKNARRFSSRETLDHKITNKLLLAHFQIKLNRNVQYFKSHLFILHFTEKTIPLMS